MHGPQIPLVMIPRFTAYAGAREFASAPVEVSAYVTGTLSVWRGFLAGDGSTFKLYVQFSSDTETWTNYPITPEEWADPGASTMKTYTFTVRDRWMRVRTVLAGENGPEVTCWASGLLVERTDG